MSHRPVPIARPASGKHRICSWMDRAIFVQPYTMRTTLFFLALAALWQGAAAQNFGLHMPVVGFRPLNHIIDRYNDSRPWLDDEMENIHLMPGLTVGLGGHPWDEDVGLYLLAWRIAGRTVEAEGNDHWRKVRVRMSTLSIMGGAYTFFQRSAFRAAIGVFPVELTNFRVKSKTDESEDGYELLWKSSNFLGVPINASSTFFLDLGSPLGEEQILTFRLFANLAWWQDEKLIYVNEELNPLPPNTMLQRQEMGTSHFGIQLLISANR